MPNEESEAGPMQEFLRRQCNRKAHPCSIMGGIVQNGSLELVMRCLECHSVRNLRLGYDTPLNQQDELRLLSDPCSSNDRYIIFRR